MLFIPVLLIMAGSLLSATHVQIQQTRLVYDQTSALYLAETALVDAVTQLEADPGWSAGFNNKRIAGIDGSYSIQFNQSGAPFSRDDSVNNLDGTHNDNFRGASAVPPGTCSLIATARVGSQTRQIEALVRLGGGLYPTDFPVLTSGKIAMLGNVTVNGIKGQADPTPVNGSVHSNFNDPGTGLISWDGNGAAQVTGKVSAVGPTANSISMGSAVLGQGKEEGAAAKAIPRVNILSKISSMSTRPAPMITPGTTTLNAGDFYKSGDITIQGDLVLTGTRLHVNGNLIVNGAIRGEGSLYVAGNTSLQGDAQVASASPDKVAVFSHGSITLSGFDGTAWMENLANNNAAFRTALSNTKNAMSELQTELNRPNPTLGRGSLPDLIRAELGTTNGYSVAIRAGKQHDNIGAMLNIVNAQPSSTARDNMVNKLATLRDVFGAFADGSQAEVQACAALQQNRITSAAIDSMIDLSDTVALPLGRAYCNSINYDKLGTSYFQGLLYTNGAFVATNEVDVLGAVVVDDDGSQADLVVNGNTYRPGSLNLLNGTGMTYVEDFFKTMTPGGGPLGMKVILWMGR